MSNRVWIAAVSLVLIPMRLSAQVGYAPDQSPFRDITTAQGFTLIYGHFTGAAARAPVGARPGTFAAARLQTRLSGPLDLWATFGVASSSRFQVVPGDTVNRVRGPISQHLVAVDLSLVLNLTGPKRWHAFAPYVGGGFGIVNGPGNQTDPGGFRVGSNFVFVPTIGTRIFLSRSLGITLEARDYWLRYEWPLAYYEASDASNHLLPPDKQVLPLNASTRQITHNATFTAGLSYLFNF